MPGPTGFWGWHSPSRDRARLDFAQRQSRALDAITPSMMSQVSRIAQTNTAPSAFASQRYGFGEDNLYPSSRTFDLPDRVSTLQRQAFTRGDVDLALEPERLTSEQRLIRSGVRSGGAIFEEQPEDFGPQTLGSEPRPLSVAGPGTRIQRQHPGGQKLFMAGAIDAVTLRALEEGDPAAFQRVNEDLQEMRRRGNAQERMTLIRLSADPDVQEFMNTQGAAFTESRQAMAPATGALGIGWNAALEGVIAPAAENAPIIGGEGGVGQRIGHAVRGMSTEQGLVLTALGVATGGAVPLARATAAGIAGEALTGEAAEQLGAPKDVQTATQIVGGVFPGTLATAPTRIYKLVSQRLGRAPRTIAETAPILEDIAQDAAEDAATRQAAQDAMDQMQARRDVVDQAFAATQPDIPQRPANAPEPPDAPPPGALGREAALPEAAPGQTLDEMARAPAPRDVPIEPSDFADEVARSQPAPIGGGAEGAAASLRNFEKVVDEVDVADDAGRVGRVAGYVAAKLGINPSVLMGSDVGRAVVARARQKIAAESLTNVAMARLNSMRQRFTGRMPFDIDRNARLKLADGQRVAWNDVFSTNQYDNLLSPEQREFIEQARKIVEETEFVRTQAGLKGRATKGPQAQQDGWWYIPRGKVQEVRGIEIQGRARPDLARHHELAEEGIQAGVKYEQDPMAVLEVHLRAAYDEVIDKQFSDWIAERAIKPSQLLPEGLRNSMDAATKRLQAAQRARRSLTVGKGVQEAMPVRGKQPTQAAVRRVRSSPKLGAARKAADAEVAQAQAAFNTVKARYKKAMDSAKAAEYGPGSLFGRQEAEIPIAKWRNNFFTRDDARLLEDWLGAFTKAPKHQNAFAKGFETLGNTIRFLSAVGDFAAPFIQGLPVLGRNPVAWARATGNHYLAFFDPTVQARMIADDIDVYQEMARHGIPVGDVEFFAALREGNMPAIGKVLNKLPKGEAVRGIFQQAGKQTFGRFGASYDAFLTSSRAQLWKAMKHNWTEGNDKLAAHIRDMTGALDSRALGVSPSQRGVEGTWMAFSPRLLRSTVALMADTTRLLKNPRDARGLAAFRALGGLTAGAIGIYVATGIGLGKSEKEIRNGLNPLQGKKFLAHEVNGDWIGLGGQVRSIAQFMAQTGAATQSPGKFLSWEENPLAQFVQGRGAPGLSVAQKTAEAFTGEDIAPFDKVDGGPDLLLHLGTSALPFAVQAVLEGQKPLTVGAALVGARTSPQTPTEKFHDTFRQAHGHDYGSEPNDSKLAAGDPRTADAYHEWRDALGEFIPDVAQQADEGRAAIADVRLEEHLGEGDEDQFKRSYNEFLSQTAPRPGEELPDPNYEGLSEEENRLLAEYWNINPFDFESDDEFNAARKAIRDQMSDDLREKLYLPRLANYYPPDHPAVQREREYLEAQQLNDELEDIPKWRGIDSEAEQAIKDWEAFVAAERGPDEELRDAEDRLSGRYRNGSQLKEWRRALDSEKGRAELLSDDYWRFLRDNEAVLRAWYPSLYMAQYIQDALD